MKGKSLKQIDDECFGGSRNLQEITIPSSVTSIGEYTFYESCKSLTSVIIP